MDQKPKPTTTDRLQKALLFFVFIGMTIDLLDDRHRMEPITLFCIALMIYVNYYSNRR